jgi:hypothetical protein
MDFEADQTRKFRQSPDEYDTFKEYEEHQAYLIELDKRRKQTIKHECENNRHTWSHCYGGYVRCSTCGEELP